MARCPRPSFRPDASPRSTISSPRGRAAGLDAVGVTAAAPFATTRRHLADRKAAGLHGGMRFTYLHPDRSTDPTTALPDARALVVGARSYRRALDRRPTSTRRRRRRIRPARGPGGPLRLGGPLRAAEGRPHGRRPAAQVRRVAGPGASPTTTPSSTARPPTAPASAGTARTPTCCCRARAAGSCSARSSPTLRSPTAARGRAGARRMRRLHPLPRRVPDRGHRRPGRGRRPPLPRVAAAGRGAVPARAPGGPGRPALRLRRLPGGVPAEPAPRPGRARRRTVRRPRARARRPRSTSSTCSPRPTTS